MCGIINKCYDNPCSANQGKSKKAFARQIEDRECGAICGPHALQYDEDFRDFLNALRLRSGVKGVKALLVCRCDKSNLNICRSAGDGQVPCCDCPLSNWPDLCMVIEASNRCVAVAISCKCNITSEKKYKESAKVRSFILDEKSGLPQPFEYLLILVPREYLRNFKSVAEQQSNVRVMRCYR